MRISINHFTFGRTIRPTESKKPLNSRSVRKCLGGCSIVCSSTKLNALCMIESVFSMWFMMRPGKRFCTYRWPAVIDWVRADDDSGSRTLPPPAPLRVISPSHCGATSEKGLMSMRRFRQASLALIME